MIDLKSIGQHVGSLFYPQADPNLTPEQNKAAQRHALLTAGLTGLLASGPSPMPRSFAQIMAQAMLSGQAAGAQSQAASAQQNLQTEIGQIAQAGSPDALRKVALRLIQAGDFRGAEQAMKLAEQMKTAEPTLQVTRPTAEGTFQITGTPGQVQGVMPTLPAAQPEGPSLPSDLEAVLWASGVDPATMTPQQRQAALAQYEALKRAGATTVNVDTGARTQAGVTEIALGDYQQIAERANAASEVLATAAELSRLLDQGVRTGAAQDMTLGLRQLAQSLGIPGGQNLSQEEAFRAISNQFALGRSQMLRGPISEKELNFITQTIPRLSNTPEGNRLIIEVMRRMAERDIQLLQLANEYIARVGELDHRWLQFKQQWIAEQDAFADLEQQYQTAPWNR